MPYYKEPKPPALNWESTVSTDIDRVRVNAAALFKSEVVGDLKTAIVRDFFEMHFRNGVINQKQRDTSIAKYLGPQPRLRLNFSTALDYLSQVMHEKQDFLTVSENLEILNQALDDVGRQGKRLNAPIVHGNRINSETKTLGTIGDVLSVGEEIFDKVKTYYGNEPDMILEIQHYCDKLETIARETDAVRQRDVRSR